MTMKRYGGIFRHSQGGDTIVEVVIAIAVIATVLTGAFVVTNRSLTAVRDSEEHSEALQLLQGQIELLRSAASQTSNNQLSGVTLTKPFCFNSSGIYQAVATLGKPCSTGNIPYNLSIVGTTANPVQGATTTFLSTVTWVALGGGTDQVQLAYKVEVE
jgi:type II secretory pathway pseudopilin PulG